MWKQVIINRLHIMHATERAVLFDVPGKKYDGAKLWVGKKLLRNGPNTAQVVLAGREDMRFILTTDDGEEISVCLDDLSNVYDGYSKTNCYDAFTFDAPVAQDGYTHHKPEPLTPHPVAVHESLIR